MPALAQYRFFTECCPGLPPSCQHWPSAGNVPPTSTVLLEARYYKPALGQYRDRDVCWVLVTWSSSGLWMALCRVFISVHVTANLLMCAELKRPVKLEAQI